MRRRCVQWLLESSTVARGALAFAAAGLVAANVVAQQPFDPLNAGEIERARQALLEDGRIRATIGSVPRYAIVGVERHVEEKGTAAHKRRADIVLYNYITRETISAVVDLAGTPRIEAFRITTDMPPPLGAEEVETAKQLAFASPVLRARLQSAGVSAADPGLIVTHLLGRAEHSSGRCSTNRCVVLFFNTRTSLLFAAAVDLTDRTVGSFDGIAR